VRSLGNMRRLGWERGSEAGGAGRGAWRRSAAAIRWKVQA